MQSQRYTGFLGPLDLQNNTAQLYVNLRCMKISPTMATLYVGGGITLDSLPKDEWQETKNKMATMLSVLGSMLPYLYWYHYLCLDAIF